MDFKSLFNLHIKYIDYLLAKSHFTHQELKNISLSGGQVESEIREIFSNLLPQRYRVTSGYILSAKDMSTEPVVSPQVDLIIVDTLVPHSIFPVSKDKNIEIVPVESVVGIFEIKRKMTKESLFGTKKKKGALEHLAEIQKVVGVDKSNQQTLMPTGETPRKGLKSNYYGNPMIGVISLMHTKSCEKLANVIKWAKEKDEHLFDGIDILYSIQGLLAHTTKKGDDSIVLYPFRENEKECVLRFVKKGKSTSQQKLFSVALGIILSFVTITVGRKNILQKYYFNESIE